MRKVNIFPSQPIQTGILCISGPILNAEVSDEVILEALKNRAKVYQVFDDMEPVQVTMANIKADLEAQAKAKQEAEQEKENALTELIALKASTYVKLKADDIITDFTGLYITDSNNSVVTINEVYSLSHYAPNVTTSYANNVFTISGNTTTPLRTIKVLIKVDTDAMGPNIVTIAKVKYLMTDADLTSKVITIADPIVDINNATIANVLLVIANNIVVTS